MTKERNQMVKYIERERIEKFFDGIYDCADLVFEPNDHCCAADDCGHCKWYEAKNAIAKRILSIPAADVVERKLGSWRHYEGELTCSECAVTIYDDIMSLLGDDVPRFCPNCGADMRQRLKEGE